MSEQPNHTQRGSASHSRTIGITQRATPLTVPWTGDLRVRFSDFQVNEIGEDGTVYHLHSIGLNDEQRQAFAGKPPAGDSEPPKQEEVPKDAAEEGKPAQGEPETVQPEDVAELEGLTSAAFAQELVHLYQASQSPETEKQPRPVTSEPIEDRPKRGQIHQAVRRIFKSKIDTSTDDNGAIIAKFVSSKKGANKRGRRDRRERPRGDPEKPEGEYIHFSLYKDNRDTMDAVNQVARLLKVKPQSINYAGTKDRRASTVQRCSLRHARMRGLAGINGKLWGVATGDYEYRSDSIHLGQLRGNEFTITIKNCQMTNAPSGISASDMLKELQPKVQSSLDHMAEHGWINYFGHQRFGTHTIGTHEIGQLLLGEKYEEAVKSLLSYDPEIAEKAENGELPEETSKRDDFLRHQACMLFKTGKDCERAAEIIPRRFTAESAILRHLNRDGARSRRDFAGAIGFITRGLRTMYLHAYQSLVWNHAASKRWEMYGDKVVKGDLVIDTTTQSSDLKEQDGDDIINPLDDDDVATPVRARALTDEDIASGRFTVYDLVLPSPGHDVQYPENEIGAFYVEFMGRPENGGLDPYSMRRMRREFSLPGRYRRVMNRFLAPPSIEFQLYEDDTAQMYPTDLDRIRAAGKSGDGRKKHARTEGGGEPLAKRVKGEDGEAVAQSADIKDGSDEKDAVAAENGDAMAVEAKEPSKIAAVVKFQLGSSAYATVTLRELMGDPPE